MDGRTNAGGVAAFAVISAKYPAGSICTCSDGNIRFTAKAASISALFFIPYAGTWTITISDPTGANKHRSTTVEITKEGENVSVELSYELWLIKDGDPCTDITGEWVINSGCGATKQSDNTRYISRAASGGEYAAYSTKDVIDLTGYSVLYLEFRSNSSADNGLAVRNSSNSAIARVDIAASSSTFKTITLDISVISSGKPTIQVANNQGIYVKNMWAE